MLVRFRDSEEDDDPADEFRRESSEDGSALDKRAAFRRAVSRAVNFARFWWLVQELGRIILLGPASPLPRPHSMEDKRSLLRCY